MHDPQAIADKPQAAEKPAAPLQKCALRPGRRTDRPVDIPHLDRYTLGNRELESEILTLFADQLPVFTNQLATAATQKDWHHAAHGLKGSARAIGANALADLAASAEQVSIEAEPQICTATLSDINDESRRVLAFISRRTSAPD